MKFFLFIFILSVPLLAFAEDSPFVTDLPLFLQNMQKPKSKPHFDSRFEDAAMLDMIEREAQDSDQPPTVIYHPRNRWDLSWIQGRQALPTILGKSRPIIIYEIGK